LSEEENPFTGETLPEVETELLEFEEELTTVALRRFELKGVKEGGLIFKGMLEIELTGPETILGGEEEDVDEEEEEIEGEEA